MRHLLATAERPVTVNGPRDAYGSPYGSPYGAIGNMHGTRDFAFQGIVGESRAVRSTVDYVRRLAQGVGTQSADRPSADKQGGGIGSALLVGPAGTGKSLFARAIHYAGEHAHLPFLVLDCRTTSDAMIETELFGYEAGAFEGATMRKPGLLELAGEGTVFIDDIAALPQRLQPKLLRALADRRVRRVGGREEYEVSCAVVVSATRPLEALVAECLFRDDLFKQLNETRIALPALRERGDDVILLAEHFLAETVREQGLLPMALAADAIQALMDYEWPGNVRELKAMIQKAAEVCTGTHIHAEHLSIQRRETQPMLTNNRAFEIAVPGDGRSLKDIEAEAIRHTLEITDGNQTAAARILEISRPTLSRKIHEYGLTNHAQRPSVARSSR